jgi:hypothetical protein
VNEPVNEPVVLVGANDADVAFKANDAVVVNKSVLGLYLKPAST